MSHSLVSYVQKGKTKFTKPLLVELNLKPQNRAISNPLKYFQFSTHTHLINSVIYRTYRKNISDDGKSMRNELNRVKREISRENQIMLWKMSI